MDLIVVHPNSARKVYGSLATDLTAIEPPIWCRIIAAYLRHKGFEVSILDMEAENLGPEDIGPIIAAAKPKLVALVSHGHQPSASTQTMAGIPAIAGAVKACGVRSIIVGGHPSALPDQTLAECDTTYVCDGEGPITIEGLLNDTPLENIPGLVWHGGKNAPAPLLRPEAGELEGDAWDLLDMPRYRAHGWQCFGDRFERKPYASIYTSFGCPYRCSFCMINAPFHSRLYRARSPDNVVAEIRFLFQHYGVRLFKFADEMFVLRPSHYLAILQLVADSGLGNEINIWAYARVDTVKEAELDLMRRGGIRWLALGIESASEYVREGSGKELRSDDIIGVVRQIQAAGINVIGNFIFGLPDDDFDTMQSTLDLALEARCEFANFYSAMAYPGSKLYDEAVTKGLSLPDAWSGYSQHSYDCKPLGNDVLSSADVLRFRDYAFDRYFTDVDYLSMIAEKFGPATLAYIKDMTGLKLQRALLEADAT